MENNIFVWLTAFLPLIGAVATLLFISLNRVQRWLGFAFAAVTWGSSLMVLGQVLGIGVQTYRMGGYIPPYGIVLVADSLSALFAVMATTVMMTGFIYTIHSHEKSSTYPAFIPLFLCMEVGLNGAFLTGDLFTYFVFMELMVLSSVSLVAISDNRYGLEAAIKYVFISGMGSLFLLLGISAMYITFGTLNLAHMGELLASGDRPLLARSAGIMLMSSFLLKSAVFPFHFWQPDFHTTAPTAVSAMLSSVIVKVGIYGVIRLVTLLFIGDTAQIDALLLLLGIIGIFFGGLTALRTYNGKRLLAYSTIGQVGFILIAISWGTPFALAAAIVYAFNHALIKSSLLMIMGLVGSYNHEHTVDLRHATNKTIEGMGQHLPALVGVLWFLGGMALAGVPPMNGFISKLMIIQSGFDHEQWLWVGLAVGSGALTLLYMFRTWQTVFQKKVPVTVTPISKGDGWLAPFLLISLCVLLGLFARPLIVIAEYTAQQISNPAIYIDAVKLFK